MGSAGQYLPNEVSSRISKLRPGDEIIILKGEGYPAVLMETVAIVWIVEEYRAICNDGTTITGFDNSDILTTGNYYLKFEVTEAAKLIEQNAHKGRLEQERALFDETDPDWSERGTFPTEPE